MIHTGFSSIDKHLKIRKGDLIVIGARVAIGKTCFLCSMVEKTIEKQKILFFSMQTNNHKAVENLQILNVKENNHFYLYDKFFDYDELLLTIAEHKLKYDIDVVIIDNTPDLYTYTRYGENQLTIKLKETAQRLNVAIILADSHGRPQKGRRYSWCMDLSQKSLIKYADKIISINRPDRSATEKELRDNLVEKDVAVITIDKDLEEYYSPWIKLKFDSNTCTFSEILKTP